MIVIYWGTKDTSSLGVAGYGRLGSKGLIMCVIKQANGRDIAGVINARAPTTRLKSSAVNSRMFRFLQKVTHQ